MVRFMSENNNVWQLPEPEAKSFAGEENSIYFQQIVEDGPLPKRWKSSSSSSSSSSSYSFQTATQPLKSNNNGLPVPQYQYNPLSEPSPLGLRLRKSPSLLELAQKRLNQCNTDKGDLLVEDLEAGTNIDLRARERMRDRARASGSADKLKASHFPALFLRIGQWEYVAKNEGDLVAKCYFSKHKIVWELLDCGLKKKFEINWADIVAMKANTAADDGLGTLTIVLDKQPLFFKEINPQPRKHTQWRASSDFTDGEASTHRHHFLQCAQGVLEKHYEKLINCDTRLNFLSQQQDIFLEFPYFAPKPSITSRDLSGSSILNLPDMYGIPNINSASALQTCPLESSSLGLIHQDLSKEARAVMPIDLEGQKDMEQMTMPPPPPTISISDIVNDLSEPKNSGNPPFSDNHVSAAETPEDMLENISQILLSDNHLPAASDEKTLLSRVNSLCCLIQDQQDGNDRSTLDPNLIPVGNRSQEDSTIGQSSMLPQDHRYGQQDGNDGSALHTNLIIMPDGNRTQEDGSIGMSTKVHPYGQQDGNGGSALDANQIMPAGNRTQEDGGIGPSTKVHPNGEQDGNDNSNPESNPMSPQDESVSGSGMSRKDSFAELVHQLPRIASLPRFLFDISENGEILK